LAVKLEGRVSEFNYVEVPRRLEMSQLTIYIDIILILKGRFYEIELDLKVHF